MPERQKDQSTAEYISSLSPEYRVRLEFGAVIKNAAQVAAHDVGLALDLYQMIEAELERRVRIFCDIARREGYEEGHTAALREFYGEPK